MGRGRFQKEVDLFEEQKPNVAAAEGTRRLEGQQEPIIQGPEVHVKDFNSSIRTVGQRVPNMTWFVFLKGHSGCCVMNGSQGTRAKAGTSVGATPTVWVRDRGALGQGGGRGERERDISGEGRRAGETDFLNATIEPTHPDRLADTLHNLPAEEAWVSLTLLLAPADHVPPIGLLVGAGIQESLEVQAVLLPKAHSVYATSLSTSLVSPKTEGGCPATPTP